MFASKVIAANKKLKTGEEGHEESKSRSKSLTQSRPKSDDLETSPGRSDDVAIEKDSDDDAQFCKGVYVLKAHERFLRDQIHSVHESKKRGSELPVTVLSKRAAFESPDEALEIVRKEEKCAGKGPRTASRMEKNRKRKLKKKKARLEGSKSKFSLGPSK